MNSLLILLLSIGQLCSCRPLTSLRAIRSESTRTLAASHMHMWQEKLTMRMPEGTAKLLGMESTKRGTSSIQVVCSCPTIIETNSKNGANSTDKSDFSNHSTIALSILFLILSVALCFAAYLAWDNFALRAVLRESMEKKVALQHPRSKDVRRTKSAGAAGYLELKYIAR